MQALSSAAEVEFVSNRDKVPQLPQFHQLSIGRRTRSEPDCAYSEGLACRSEQLPAQDHQVGAIQRTRTLTRIV
jgi:hypothetical protein